MSMNIKRDEHGCPILSGSKTFGNVIRPKGGRRQPRIYALKDAASKRLVAMMTAKPVPLYTSVKYGETPNEYIEEVCETREVLDAQNKMLINKLRRQIIELQNCGNQRKIEFELPMIINEINKLCKEIGSELSDR